LANSKPLLECAWQNPLVQLDLLASWCPANQPPGREVGSERLLRLRQASNGSIKILRAMLWLPPARRRLSAQLT
jgi:hypothetical protein